MPLSFESMIEENGYCGIFDMATGTGKTYNALQLAYDNKDKKILFNYLDNDCSCCILVRLT